MAKSKTAVTDPLEAAKIASPLARTAPPPPAAEPGDLSLAAPDPLPEVPEASPAEPFVSEDAAPPVAVAPAAPMPKVKKYRVAETTTISLGGQLTRLNKDDVVSESSYGPAGMRAILGSNVGLVEIEA